MDFTSFTEDYNLLQCKTLITIVFHILNQDFTAVNKTVNIYGGELCDTENHLKFLKRS